MSSRPAATAEKAILASNIKEAVPGISKDRQLEYAYLELVMGFVHASAHAQAVPDQNRNGAPRQSGTDFREALLQGQLESS